MIVICSRKAGTHNFGTLRGWRLLMLSYIRIARRIHPEVFVIIKRVILILFNDLLLVLLGRMSFVCTALFQFVSLLVHRHAIARI